MKETAVSDFPETLWSVIARRKGEDAAEATAALERLCTLYRPAVRAVLLRWGSAESEVDDLTQEFFAGKFLHPNFFANVRPGKGKFRTFLKTALRNFLHTNHRRKRREVVVLSLDATSDGLGTELEDPGLVPDEWMDFAFANQLVANARNRLQEEAQKAGKAGLSRALCRIMDGEEGAPSLKAVAQEFGLSENHAGVVLHRYRERLRWLIRDEVRQTVANPAEWEAEMEHLVAVLMA